MRFYYSNHRFQARRLAATCSPTIKVETKIEHVDGKAVEVKTFTRADGTSETEVYPID